MTLISFPPFLRTYPLPTIILKQLWIICDKCPDISGIFLINTILFLNNTLLLLIREYTSDNGIISLGKMNCDTFPVYSYRHSKTGLLPVVNLFTAYIVHVI